MPDSAHLGPAAVALCLLALSLMEQRKKGLRFNLIPKRPLQGQKLVAVLVGISSFVCGLALSLAAAMHFGFIPDISKDESIAALTNDIEIFADSDKFNSGDDFTRTAGDQSAATGSAGKTTFKKSGSASKSASSDEADPTLSSLLGKLKGEVADGGQSDSGAQNEIIPEFDRESVLNDYDQRINDQFAIPEALRDRVGFWFDVYTRYDSNRRVIHHTRFPWIIYKVVDVTPIINAPTPRRRWMRNEKADKFVKAEHAKIRAAIQSVARKSSIQNLSEYERMVVDALSKLEGDVLKNAKLAQNDVRIQTGQRNFFIEGLEVSPRYLPTMEKIFKKARLPVELTRIPFVESSFKKHATSKVGAAGIWQFMGNTGRKFMIVDGNIDERRSPFKATEAAARLLKENHMILYRAWPLAITAWNHGPGGVRKATQAVGSRDISKIVGNYRSKTFDFASSNFYAEFLAALHAQMYNPEVYGKVRREATLDLDIVTLPKSIRVSEIIRVSGLSATEFLSMNPELKLAATKNISLPVGFKLHVPDFARAIIERHLALGYTREGRST